ncbi:MAG: tetratricopeptide repeat protein [Gammaproteobacteria bacterium]|nr:tetratricopeptide repeat protein [Gammaproteobacteria bacterium]NIR81798.1 tetratricopeptide repeat protein [Gammaproteobacteria bacterium]NIR88630.1 tetratricopeptide repeat protein [Gammaproteobacteria bacterium]NIU02906.1 tetratricopeptide repeat protein [Gammaproteobacteria bacterium]NIV50427.1 tetratricopeptide repeat protein [Gammaproteobacteria bacterium]
MGMIENLEAMLAAGKDGALLRYGLGNEYLKEGRFEQAAEHLSKAVQYDPDYSAAWKIYGKALAQCGRREEALNAYQAGIEAAEKKGDIQAAKEMRVFLRRLEKSGT